jgi:hypothetical protein
VTCIVRFARDVLSFCSRSFCSSPLSISLMIYRFLEGTKYEHGKLGNSNNKIKGFHMMLHKKEATGTRPESNRCAP